MIKYEIWALAIDYSIKDGLDDSCVGSFEEKETAQWFFDNYPFTSIPNTTIHLEKVEYDNEGNATCLEIIDEKEV